MAGGMYGQPPVSYGTYARSVASPSRLSEDEAMLAKLSEYVSTGALKNIMQLLKKKRFTASDLLKREIQRLKSAPSDVGPVPESVRDFDIDDSGDEEDARLRSVSVADDSMLLPPAKSWAVSFEEENTSRLLIYARQEWRHTQKLAVEASVAELIMHALPRRRPLRDGKTTKTVLDVAKKYLSIEGTELQLLDLIHEFIAGGFEPAQNALLAAVCSVDYDDDNDKATADVDRKDLFIRFLLRYVAMADSSLSPALLTHYQNRALSIVQLLCENHHEMWQSVVSLEVDGKRILLAVVDAMGAAISISLNNPALLKCMAAITEACQGPNKVNQELIVNSNATALCCKLLMNDQAVDMTIHQAATELLLSLMEGRTDQSTQATIAQAFSADVVVLRLQLYHKALLEQFGSPLDFAKHDIHRAPMYKKAMNLTRLVVRIMSLEQASGSGDPSGTASSPHALSADADQDELDEADDAEDRMAFEVHMRAKLNSAVLGMLKRSESESDVSTLATAIKTVLVANRALRSFDTRSVQGFRALWESAVATYKAQSAQRFFNAQLISVEILRYGKHSTVYFVKPHDAMYFDEQLQNDLLDAMDIGGEHAMDVLLSEQARDTEEELKVVKHLKRLTLYSLMSSWQMWLRTRLLALCFYINFVLLLMLRIDKTTKYPYVTILGSVYCGLSAVLFVYYLMRTFNFHYCKQQLSITKLKFRSPKTIHDRKWEAFQDPIFYLELIAWTYSLIVWVYGWTAFNTVVLGLGAFLLLFFSTLSGLRKYAEIMRFSVNQEITYKQVRMTTRGDQLLPKVYFWYNVLYDTLFSENVVRFAVFTACAILGLVDETRYFLYYGVPLADLINLHFGLKFVVKAMNMNMGKLAITAAFGGVVIYFFALLGYYFFQPELSSGGDDANQCSTLMHCVMTYLHSGLLNGGGIGDYLSDVPMNYNEKGRYFGRVFYELAFFIVVITLILNLIQGIIIDAFTAVREASENKLMLRRTQCLVCNRPRAVIEAQGMEAGIMNSFARHTETKHNLWHYFFFIKYLNSKDETDMNGMESFVFEKIKAKDMSWVPHI
ncbi:hypothetical protein SPRG_02777 [Saprolegnia parasitica CBS 223.65]|uniref:Ion transport domain-containing protein n=1 Tax=Saprolegnia parasitica (strain CBS 223.65) TaxID=695850 RepID=A0A067CP85_SAPPC|nr:hypothetical protein SPRG_02777 [Saprolegnia parasitica CBS 223.65]KDO32298.1 hypothetical protein SPRG_02777 [Saprolegnia parasitica CBS 223.65]|eukprot:XP_012196754.1 hypothetical protein SPRG_02777 [Saprolegnia parasitica CBS 223.65]